MANYNAVTQTAQNVAATPYQGYGGELVAGINPQQYAGIGAVNSASGIENPYNAGATNFANSSTGAVQQFSPQQIAQYESPYQSDVIAATEREIQNQNQQQAAQLTSGAIGSGAFGGDRAGIAQAALAGQQDIANNATIANLYNQNYAQALGEFNTQQAVQQNQYQRQLAAAGLLGQLGQTAQGEALQEANAQTNAGTLEQTTQQAQDTARYNQFLQQQAYPFETTGWLANIVEGIGSQSGGSSTGTTTQEGNAGSQIGGALLGLASFLARGGRVPHRDQGGGIYLPQAFDPTSGTIAGIGGGQFVPQAAPLGIGHTMPTQGAPAPVQSTQSSITPQSIQAAGKGLKDAYNKLTTPQVGDPMVINDLGTDNALGVSPNGVGGALGSGDMASLTDAGLGGIFARGGSVRRYADGGAPAGFQLNADPRPMPQKPAGIAAAPSGPPARDPGPVAPIISGPLMRDPGPQGIVGSPSPLSNSPSLSTQTQYSTAQQAPAAAPASSSASIDSKRGAGTWQPMSQQFQAPTPGMEIHPGGAPAQPAPAPAPSAPPTPVTQTPANAPSYSVFPIQMSDGSWTTSQNLRNGIAQPGFGGFARGGIVRPHYDDGGIVPSGDPSFDMAPEVLLLGATAPPRGIDAAAAMPVPNIPVAPGGDMPAPNVAQEESAARLGSAAGIAAPPLETASSYAPVPTPPPRSADLGAAPAPSGITPQSAPYMAAPTYAGPAPAQIDPSQYENTQAGHEAFIRDYAAQRGVDPDFAASVARAEGLGALSARNPNAASSVDIDPRTGQPFSFGDYQLNVRNGLGNLAMASGIDPKDPTQWQAADKFAIDYMAKNGLQPWRGDAAVKAYAAGSVPTPALAFDNGRTGVNAPAAQAISAAAPPPGGIARAAPSMQTSMPQFPDSIPTPESGRTGLLGLNLSPETRQLMLSAGLGIMGAQGRSFLGNVGTGAMQGIAAARQNANLSSEAGLRLAQTQGAQIENQIKAQQLKLMMDALDGHADAISSAANAPSPTTPTITKPGVAGQEAAPAVARPQLDPEFDPSVLARQADRLVYVNPQAAALYRERAQQILQSGRSRDVSGNIVNLPGFVGAESELAANKAGAEAAAKSHYDLQEVQPEAGGPTRWVPKSQLLKTDTPVGVGAGSPPGSSADAAAAANPDIAKQPAFYAKKQEQIGADENQMVQQYQARQLSRQRLQTLAQIMQTYQPGTFAQQKSDIVASLRSVGIPVPDTATANPAAFQEFSKNAVANVFNDVKAQGGGRILVSEIQGLTKANANAELQPAAAAAIIGQGLGVLDYEDQHTRDYFDWKGKHPNATNTAEFELPWADSHPVGRFVEQATKGIGYSGQAIPAPAQRVSGQTYMTPKGPAIWRGNGWQLQGTSP